jgi:WD40 domain-containing protein
LSTLQCHVPHGGDDAHHKVWDCKDDCDTTSALPLALLQCSYHHSTATSTTAALVQVQYHSIVLRHCHLFHYDSDSTTTPTTCSPRLPLPSFSHSDTHTYSHSHTHVVRVAPRSLAPYNCTTRHCYTVSLHMHTRSRSHTFAAHSHHCPRGARTHTYPPATATSRPRAQAGVTCVRWSADGAVFVSSSVDRSIKIWDTRSCNCVRTIEDAHDRCTMS